MLGVAFVAGTLIFTDTLDRSFTSIFDSSVGDVVVAADAARPSSGSDQTTLPCPPPWSTELADAAGRRPGRRPASRARASSSSAPTAGWSAARAPRASASTTPTPAAGGVEPLRCSGAAPRGEDEVAIDAATARRAGYALGEQVRLVSAGSGRCSRRAGRIADFPDGGSLNGASVELFDTATAQQLFLEGRDVFTDVWVTAKPGVARTELRDEVADVLPTGYEAHDRGARPPTSRPASCCEAISFLTVFLLVFAGIALVVGSFLIVNTFSMLVAQRSRELALLRALGASRGQVTRSVLFEALVVGLRRQRRRARARRAAGARHPGAVRHGSASTCPAAGLVVSPRTPVAAFGVGVLVTVVAAYLPARRSSRIPPIAALRDDVAMPESALRLRLLAGTAAGARRGRRSARSGCSPTCRSRATGSASGALLAMLGVAAASPVASRPFLRVAAVAYRRALRQRRRARRAELAAQPPAYGGHGVGADDRPDPGHHDVDRRHLGQGQRRPHHRAHLPRRHRGQQRHRPGLLAAVAPTASSGAGRRVGDPAAVRPEPSSRASRAFLTGADPRTLATVLRLDLTAGSLADFRGDTLLVERGRGGRGGLRGRRRAVLPLPQGRDRAADRGHPRRRSSPAT